MNTILSPTFRPLLPSHVPPLLTPNPNRTIADAFHRFSITHPNPKRLPLLAASAFPGGDHAEAGEREEEAVVSESDRGDGIEIEVMKVGSNRRRIEAQVKVNAELETVWGLLTDYEGLASFIPSLLACELLERGDGFAKIYQVGQQDLALGLKFNAKGILDCYEKELELFPYGRRRDIKFQMVEGDFKIFEGMWSIVQNKNEMVEDVAFENETRPDFRTSLSYVVELEPKLWLPIRLLEGRICREIRINLSSVRDEAQRIQGRRN